MMSLIWGLGIMVPEAKAQTVYAYTDVQYVPSNRYVDGYTTTWLDYLAGLYYDPAVRGELYRTDMNEEPLDEGYDVGFADIIDAEVYLFSTNYVEGKTYCTSGTHFIIDAFTGNRTIVFRFYPCITIPIPPPPTPPLPTPTPNVTSVTFEQIQTSTEPISPNPVVSPHNPGIGRRIFPDDDVPQDGVDRRLVRVTAALSQPIPNVLVYFRNFDLDDPATDPIIDPLGNAGDDNNGMPRAGTLRECSTTSNGCSASTDSSGVATVVFTVIRQPGDNFAIAAGVIPAEVGAVNMNGIDLINGSGQVIPTSCSTELVCRSEMLTVWRRLHIEVDSMGEPQQNFVLGTTTQIVRIRAGQQATIPVTSGQPLEENRFENGRIVVNNRSFRVINNTANTVDVQGGGALTTIFSGSMYQLFDDDDFNDDDGPPPGDGTLDGDTETDENIPEPPDSLLQPNDSLCSQS